MEHGTHGFFRPQMWRSAAGGLCLLGAGLLSGCLPGFGLLPATPAARPGNAPAPTPVTTTQPGPSGRLPGAMVMASTNPKARLFKLMLPVGTLSLNEKFWRQVNEDALDSATAVLLARNGFRAAVAPQDRWPEISRLIDVPGASMQEFFCQTDGRTPLSVVTRANVVEQTIFFTDQDLHEQGRTFGQCDNSMRLAMSRGAGQSEVLLQLEPVVQTGTIAVARGAQELGVVRQTIPQEETFANLRLAVKIKPTDFLILAPANPKGNDFSVGTRFLSDTDHVPALEMVLVVVPIQEAAK